MKHRVEQRPFLFERESQENAKRKAEKKYTQILRDAGVHEHLVRKLVTKDGEIIDGEDSEEDSGELEERQSIDDDNDDDTRFPLRDHRAESGSENSQGDEMSDENFEDEN